MSTDGPIPLVSADTQYQCLSFLFLMLKVWQPYAFGALTLLDGCQKEHLAFRN